MTERDIPLCVDLDGTLVRSDLLVESALALLRRNPLYLFLFPAWLLRGKAYLKRAIARRVVLDVTRLPYDARVLAWLREGDGNRRRILCTAADQQFADAVAAHVGGFDEACGSDGARNLGGRAKCAALRERFGPAGFDYVGNDRSDLHVWRAARRATVVDPSPGLLRRVRAACTVEQVFERGGGQGRGGCGCGDGRLRREDLVQPLHRGPAALVIISSLTMMSAGSVSPFSTFTALSTAALPISYGNCATDASILPSAIAFFASSSASKPITLIVPVLLAAAIASMAPSAIKSLAAKTVSMSGCACSMFWNTLKP